MTKAPSLVDLCVQLAIDNVRHLADVGETDFHLLDRILPHCTLDQLIHVENCTKGRDLSPVTDKLWKRFYELQFGAKSTNHVVERMKQKKVTFKWRQLYEAKSKDVEEAQEKSFDRIKRLYEEDHAMRQSKKVKLCNVIPPSSSKRRFFGSGGPGSNIGNTKSNLMKKAKLEFLNSREVKNLAAVRNNSNRSYNSVPPMRKLGAFSGKPSSSVSKVPQGIPRRS